MKKYDVVAYDETEGRKELSGRDKLLRSQSTRKNFAARGAKDGTE